MASADNIPAESKSFTDSVLGKRKAEHGICDLTFR
jgi:hypothetical protein